MSEEKKGKKKLAWQAFLSILAVMVAVLALGLSGIVLLGSGMGVEPEPPEVKGRVYFDDIAVDGNISWAYGEENIGLPSVTTSAVITTTTDGALFTVADGEVWIVHDMWINVTADFDCTGDDCALILGDGGDTDGFCVLADAQLQAADTVATGFPAGWQCMEAATRGVYLDEVTTNAYVGGFIYTPSGAAETIDVDVSGTDIVSGTATVYISYTRLQ